MNWILLLDVLSKIGGLLSGLGIFWVAVTYWEQKKQNRVQLRMNIADRVSSLFEEANKLFDPGKVSDLTLNHPNQALDQTRRQIFLLSVSVFFEKLDFAIGLAKSIDDRAMIEKLTDVANASVIQSISIAAISDLKMKLERFTHLQSVLTDA